MSFLAGLLIKLGLLAVAVGGVFVGKKCFHAKDDNIVEEVVEQVIVDELGVKIDITPDSPEPEQPSNTIKEISAFVEKQIDRI